jgi:hypothetical protein
MRLPECGSGAILLLLEVRISSVMGLLMTMIVLALRRKLRPTLRVFFRANQDRGHKKFVICLRVGF